MVAPFVIAPEQALYCADPDKIAECIKICAAADVSAIGLRLGSYLQAISFFVLVLVAPDEGGSEAVWLSLSVSYAFLLTNFVQLYLGSITLHHTVVVVLLSSLPYVATMAGMNSLTTFRGLGRTGMVVLQVGLFVKAILTALLWAFCLVAWFHGQLPKATRLMFRQPHCFESTAIVAFFIPLRRTDEHYGRSRAILIAYTIMWGLILVLGSWWTIKAPIVLRRRGGHLRPKPKAGSSRYARFFRTPAEKDADEQRRQALERHGGHYTPSSEEGDNLMVATMRSLPKGRSSSAEASKPLARPRPSAGLSLTGPLWAGGVAGRTPQEASQAWSQREIDSRHHFIIWPLVAILLTFTILSTELQIAMNDIYVGEMHWDFPGTLSFLLAFPTVWSVIKAINRIRAGRRPEPFERPDETFLELGKHHRTTRSGRRARRARSDFAPLSSAESDSDLGLSVERKGRRR